ncbi:MAG: ATP-binding protein [Nitriliruptoraceae bacterium]
MHADLLYRARLLGGLILPPVLLFEGGAGTGKTALLRQIAQQRELPLLVADVSRDTDLDALTSRLHRACVRAQRDDLALALCERPASADARLSALRTALRDTDDGVILVVDGAHNLEDPAVERLARFAAELPGGHHLAVLTDRINGSLARLRLLTPAIVTADHLRFTRDEVVALLDARRVTLRPRQIDELRRVTDGVPLAVDVAVRHLAATDPSMREDAMQSLVDRGDVVAAVIDTHLPRRWARRRAALLRHVSRINTQMAAAGGLDTQLLESFTAAGLLHGRDAGRRTVFHVPRAVGSRMPSRIPPPRILRRVATAGRSTAMLGATIDLLVDLGADRLAARTVLASTPVQLAALGAHGLADRLARIRPHVRARRPLLDLLLARAQRNAGRFATALAHLDAAEPAARRATDRVAIRVERLGLSVAIDGPNEASADLVRRLSARSGRRTPDLAPRIAELAAVHAVWSREDDWPTVARAAFTRAQEGFVALDETARAGLVDLQLAAEVSLPCGAADEAIIELDRAVVCAPSAVQPVVLALRARARARAGRTVRARVDLAEAERIARILGAHDVLLDVVRTEIAARPARRRPGRTTARTAARVEVGVLGGLTLIVDGNDIAVDDRNARTLVEVVAVHGGRMHRRELGRALWGEAVPDDSDRWLDAARSALPDNVIVVDGDFVGFVEGTQLDVWEFLDLAREALGAPARDHVDVTLAAIALDLYDDLLPGRDDPKIDRARRRIRERALALVDALLDAPDTAEADRRRWAALGRRLAESGEHRQHQDKLAGEDQATTVR